MAKNTHEFDGLTIGSKCFAVHRSVSKGDHMSGSIFQVRIIRFENVQGKLEVVFKQVGYKQELRLSNYFLFKDINKAINVLMGWES